MYRFAKPLLFLFCVFGLFFKYVQFARIRLNIYIIILILALAVLPVRRLIKAHTGKEMLKLRLPYIFLLLISVLALFQFYFLESSPNLNVALIYLFAALTFFVFTELMQAAEVNINSIFKLLLAMSLCSTVFVILQTQISPVFDIAPHLDRLGLATIYHAERVQSLVSVRGRGLGITIGDYATHNFIPFFFVLFMVFKTKLNKRLWYLLAFGILCVGMVISNTDSVFLGIAIAFVVWFLENSSKWKIISPFNLLLLLVCVCIVVAFLLPYLSDVSQHGQEIASSSIASRLYMWSVAVSMFLENPLTGIGIGAFSQSTEMYLPHFFVKGHYAGMSAHSMVFDVLAGGGIVGLALFLGFLITVGIRARNCAKYSNFYEDKVLYLSFIAYIVMGLFGNIHIFGLDLYFIGALIQYRYELLQEKMERAKGEFKHDFITIPTGEFCNIRTT